MAASLVMPDALPAPLQALLPYLPEDWRSVSKLLPVTAPSTPLGSLQEGKEVGRAVGNTWIPDPRPWTPGPSPASLQDLSYSGFWGPEAAASIFQELPVPPTPRGSLSVLPSKSLPASLLSPG